MAWDDDEILLLVLELGSFTAAAERLFLPTSTVSRKVARLEASLGVQLLRRTTRSLHLTPAGEVYAQEMSDLLARKKHLLAQLSELATEPAGHLRVSCPSRFTDLAGPMFSTFLRQYPKVSLQVAEEDRVVDLIGEGIDLALRGSSSTEPGLVAARLVEVSFKIFASPTMDLPIPISKLSELSDLPCVLATSTASETWTLSNENDVQSVQVRGRFASRNLHVRHNAVLWGVGLGLLPEMHCQAQLHSGHLCAILPDWKGPTSALWLVYPQTRYRSLALRALIEHVGNYPWLQTLSAINPIGLG